MQALNADKEQYMTFSPGKELDITISGNNQPRYFYTAYKDLTEEDIFNNSKEWKDRRFGMKYKYLYLYFPIGNYIINIKNDFL